MQVSDVMTRPVVTTRADATIEQAVRAMIEHGISGLPVIDDTDRLIGIITEGDFLRRVESGTERHRPRWLEFLLGPGRIAEEYVHTHGRRVSEVMTPEVVTVAVDTPLEDAVRLMERRRVKRLPVLRDGRLVGIVSRANLLRPLLHSMDRMAAHDTDEHIRDCLMAELTAQTWAPQASIEVVVRNGEVDFWGGIFDQRQREALRVAAENVPGVRRVRDHLVWAEPNSGIVVEAPAEPPDKTEPGAR